MYCVKPRPLTSIKSLYHLRCCQSLLVILELALPIGSHLLVRARVPICRVRTRNRHQQATKILSLSSNSQMSKSIKLRTDLSIQHHHIVCVAVSGLEEVIQRFSRGVDWSNEFVEVKTRAERQIPLPKTFRLSNLLQIEGSPQLNL